MVTVAIAGATGHIGKAILDVLKKNQAHKVIALSRKVLAIRRQVRAAC
jgi:NAD dependent epimerase/dehydratase family enzyme